MVQRIWPGSTVVCIASGPSLTQTDVNYVRGKARVIVVNNNYQLAPWADVLYAHDARWWRWHKGVPDFRGLKYSMQQAEFSYRDVTLLKRGEVTGLSMDPSVLNHGRNSGYQAINLAVHLGAALILLLGYDMQCTDGRSHHHRDHPVRANNQTNYEKWIPRYATLVKPLQAAGVRIVNCTVTSALTCFPRMPLRDVLPDVLEKAS